MTEDQKEGKKVTEKPSPEKDPSLVPQLWDPFVQGCPRGKPGSSDFDDHINQQPWKKE